MGLLKGFNTNTKLFVCLVWICALVSWYGLKTFRTSSYYPVPAVTHRSRKEAGKVILFTTRSHWNSNVFEGVDKAGRLCPRCEFTHDKKRWKESDAILFNGRFLEKNVPEKSRGQVWIYYYMDSPDRKDEPVTRNLNLYKNLFNWTMTYRRDSDIFRPYAEVVRVTSQGRVFNEDEIKMRVRNKTGVIAWIVSNCKANSKRGDLVKELAKHVSIDIYGKCGMQQCPTNRSQSEGADCRSFLSSKYKFYLSFENSLCEDYVTEKFFDVFDTDMVPLVYSGANYKALGAPDGSYINVADFESVQALADHIRWLDAHPEEYTKYLESRAEFKAQNYFETFWCKICHKLFEQNDKPNSHVYEDLSKWWKRTSDGRQMCVPPPKIVQQILKSE